MIHRQIDRISHTAYTSSYYKIQNKAIRRKMTRNYCKQEYPQISYGHKKKNTLTLQYVQKENNKIIVDHFLTNT